MTLPNTLLFDPLQETELATTGTTTGTPDGGVPGEEVAAQPGWIQFMPFVLMFAIFWFLLIRPEKKRRAQTQAMLSALKKGDHVMTSSGMHATVISMTDEDVTLQVADGVRIKFSRAAIQSVVDGGGDSSSDS